MLNLTDNAILAIILAVFGFLVLAGIFTWLLIRLKNNRSSTQTTITTTPTRSQWRNFARKKNNKTIPATYPNSIPGFKHNLTYPVAIYDPYKQSPFPFSYFSSPLSRTPTGASASTGSSASIYSTTSTDKDFCLPLPATVLATSGSTWSTLTSCLVDTIPRRAAAAPARPVEIGATLNFRHMQATGDPWDMAEMGMVQTFTFPARNTVPVPFSPTKEDIAKEHRRREIHRAESQKATPQRPHSGLKELKLASKARRASSVLAEIHSN